MAENKTPGKPGKKKEAAAKKVVPAPVPEEAAKSEAEKPAPAAAPLPPKPPRKLGFSLANFILGLFILLIGVILLGKTTGLYELDIDLAYILKFWPVLIILFGISLMTRRGWVSFVIALLVTIVVISLVVSSIVFGATSRATVTEDISIAKETGVDSAQIKLDTGAIKLDIEGGSDELVTGDFISDSMELKTESEVSDSLQTVDFRTTGDRTFFWPFTSYRNEMDLAVSSDIPVDLELDNGASEMTLDLSEVETENLNIKSGASIIDLIMGDKAKICDVTIDSGASTVHITLPRSVGARIKDDSGVSTKNFHDFDSIGSNVYESDNYQDAARKINISLKLGVSTIDVNWE
jgi:hypothetical protein